jgi:citrate synthase
MAEKGLEGIIASDSSICTVDGLAGRLAYRGIDINILAEQSNFEEVVYFLWHGYLPTQSQLDALKAELAVARALPEGVLDSMRLCPKNAAPMDMLRTVVSLLGMYDPDAENVTSREANLRIATRLTAQIATIVATFHRLRSGQEPIPPDPNLSHAANFLYMLNGQRPSPTAERIFDMSLVLHADHEFNASTFAARVTASTLSDMYSAMTTALGTLKGPLHGGANEGVMEMLLKIGDADNVESYIRGALARKERIPGFGHRVYKTWDPRALCLRGISEELARSVGDMKWYEMSRRAEQIVMAEKGLYPNVDFYSASVYYYLGIPVDLFTPIFAVSRVAGWTAHILEQQADNRLIRPRARYVGPASQPYIPIAERGN